MQSRIKPQKSLLFLDKKKKITVKEILPSPKLLLDQYQHDFRSEVAKVGKEVK
jgi:hypothetical protein